MDNYIPRGIVTSWKEPWIILFELLNDTELASMYSIRSLIFRYRPFVWIISFNFFEKIKIETIRLRGDSEILNKEKTQE